MRTRIQLAGGEYGSIKGSVWKGELALINGFPGMRFSLYNEEGTPEVYIFKQLCIELSKDGVGEPEQVIYVGLQEGSPVLLG